MKILFSDVNIAVCVKPVGLDAEHDVPQALILQLGGDIYPIHRLDKNVGGVMSMPAIKKLPHIFPS